MLGITSILHSDVEQWRVSKLETSSILPDDFASIGYIPKGQPLVGDRLQR